MFAKIFPVPLTSTVPADAGLLILAVMPFIRTRSASVPIAPLLVMAILPVPVAFDVATMPFNSGGGAGNEALLIVALLVMVVLPDPAIVVLMASPSDARIVVPASDTSVISSVPAAFVDSSRIAVPILARILPSMVAVIPPDPAPPLAVTQSAVEKGAVPSADRLPLLS